MYYAYVLKSIKHDFYYKGHCENLEERLKQHNSGKTKSYAPFAMSKAEIEAKSGFNRDSQKESFGQSSEWMLLRLPPTF